MCKTKVMSMECKLKEKHYKKGRFNVKSERELSEFKKEKITQDLNEIIEIAQDNLDFNYQLIKKNGRINIPNKNSVLSIRTQSQINAFSIFLQFIEKYETLDFLSIQTYTIDEKTVFTLKKLIDDGIIKKLQIVMTETACFRIPKIYRLLKDLFSEHEKVNLCFYWVHSKVHMIRAGNDKYVIDGSGNFSMNAQVEQYNIFNSDFMFDKEYEFQNSFFFGEKLRKKHEIYKNY